MLIPGPGTWRFAGCHAAGFTRPTGREAHLAERISLSYDPPGETLRAFRKSNATARALVGPIQGGRKTCAVADMLRRALDNGMRRVRWIAVRAESSALEEQTIMAWHRRVPPRVGGWDANGLRCRVDLVGRGGQPIDFDILFLALDRPEHRRRLQSAEATGFWLDGARDLDEATFDRALELAGSWPLDEASSPMVICTSRMPSTDEHWLATRSAASGSDLALFRQPGGRTPQAENLKHLKPGFYQRLGAGRGFDWVRGNVDAEYGVSQMIALESADMREALRRRLARLAEAQLAERAAEQMAEQARAA